MLYLRKEIRPEGPKIFLSTEQNSSRIRVSEQNFEQNKRFLRALPASRISHFTSRIYPSLSSGSNGYIVSYRALILLGSPVTSGQTGRGESIWREIVGKS